MISTEYDFLTMINSPVRQFKGRVGLYEGSTLLSTFNHDDALQSFTIDRASTQGKLFGYGICQKLTLKLVDTKREINIEKGNALKVEIGVENEYICPYPTFYITEVLRDENTNGLTVTAYDALYEASTHTVSEMKTAQIYTVQEFIAFCAHFLGLTFSSIGIDTASLTTYYETDANFEGTETIREALDAAAEATQAIYYVNNNDVLVFKRLDIEGDSLLTIDKSKYFELKAKTSHTVTGVSHVTELGDNFTTGTDTGEMVYIRDNPFWELRDDVATLVDNAFAQVQGLTIVQYECNWRGNFLMEIGDKINLITKDDGVVTTYLLNDTTTYNGALSEKSDWSYSNSGTSTPNTISEVIRQTYAKVNRAEQEIELVASSAAETSNKLASISLDTGAIYTTIEQVDKSVNTRLDATDESIATLTERLTTTATKNEIDIKIKETLESGVGSISTETGYTFNNEGLTISKSDSEMKTTVTEDGMTVYKNGDAMLTANNTGVGAVNLHAKTYLIIGSYSRFEDYKANSGKRTGCFWIG